MKVASGDLRPQDRLAHRREPSPGDPDVRTQRRGNSDRLRLCFGAEQQAPLPAVPTEVHASRTEDRDARSAAAATGACRAASGDANDSRKRERHSPVTNCANACSCCSWSVTFIKLATRRGILNRSLRVHLGTLAQANFVSRSRPPDGAIHPIGVVLVDERPLIIEARVSDAERGYRWSARPSDEGATRCLRASRIS
jgi:hypothetical protein